MRKPAQQGHRYELNGRAVLALESGPRVRVAELIPGQPWIGSIWRVRAVDLTPQPMVYFHNEVPR
jgi:hypothetical protein